MTAFLSVTGTVKGVFPSFPNPTPGPTPPAILIVIEEDGTSDVHSFHVASSIAPVSPGERITITLSK